MEDGPVKRWWAAVGSVAFFFVAAGCGIGLVPWWLTGWQVRDPLPYWAPLRVVGAVLVVVGVAVVARAFVRFVVEGLGTPMPVAPPERLVVGGLYRHVRNPMYVAVLTAVVGETLLLGQVSLLIYAACVAAATSLFVRLYEEPALRRRFGEQYDAYRRAVPGWWPRLHPWRPE
jgi:protein-S-isoprenylcysteine O-methyltransferase Ste14